MSKTIIGLIIAIFGLIKSRTGWDWFSDAEVESFANLVFQGGGIIFAWYGRMKASGPINVLGQKAIAPLLLLFLAGCAGTSPENVAAIRAANEAVPALLEKSRQVQGLARDGYVVALNKWVDAALDNAVAWELSNIPEGGWTPDAIQKVYTKAAAKRAEATAEIANLTKAATTHEVDKQLDRVVQLLHDYVLSHTSLEEVQWQLSQDAHNLFRKE